MCKLDPAHFLSVSELAWQACLKITEIKLELLTPVDMLLMVEKGIRRGLCHAINRYVKANNKYIFKIMVNICSVFGRKQFVLMGNVSKITCK